jgi:glycerate kinase
MRVLIAPDKFKGSLSAAEAAAALAEGWREGLASRQIAGDRTSSGG